MNLRYVQLGGAGEEVRVGAGGGVALLKLLLIVLLLVILQEAKTVRKMVVQVVAPERPGTRALDVFVVGCQMALLAGTLVRIAPENTGTGTAIVRVAPENAGTGPVAVAGIAPDDVGAGATIVGVAPEDAGTVAGAWNAGTVAAAAAGVGGGEELLAADAVVETAPGGGGGEHLPGRGGGEHLSRAETAVSGQLFVLPRPGCRWITFIMVKKL